MFLAWHTRPYVIGTISFLPACPLLQEDGITFVVSFRLPEIVSLFPCPVLPNLALAVLLLYQHLLYYFVNFCVRVFLTLKLGAIWGLGLSSLLYA